MNSILRTGPMAQFKWVEEMAKQGREKQKQFLLYFIQMLETAIRIRFGNEPSNSGVQLDDKEQGRLDFARKLNKIGQPEQLESMATLLNNSIYQIERNANAKLLFHALSIRLYHLIGNKTLILI
jgi:DNA polymerase-3 subunit delta'